ncbi:PDDEXK family nuclease [Tepidibacter formicigenes]|jgi:hypothetical protein|uniref:DUF91 domain-containing protein n=1 Tax=Tepidibacter formicigenes DSM 15518 TaxID=1123349 RepID=A0A1M6RJX1_9FIRM|nr:hypothetical protein [Tepidibacter formicigenes]SHK32716.1 hypothetical protein SAMN02744037_02127 [Tepidibacter formicigenes DSM 15518]
MNLLEEDIEEIIYNSPWLLDERYIIPKIKGTGNQYGRQVNVGKNGSNRYIDLLFKDTRDNRPVIIELKKDIISRESIAQILEYRALVVSLDENKNIDWKDEFGQNYYCPKLILIGANASEEVKISANLAGIEIRELVGIDNLEVSFDNIGNLKDKLEEWNDFLNTGNRTLEDRPDWIEEIHSWTKEVIHEYDDKSLTITKLCKTTGSNSWATNMVNPFINISIENEEYYIGGFYEYYDEELRFSSEHIYFDFWIQKFNNLNNDAQKLNGVNRKLLSIFKEAGYDIFKYDEGTATIKISRKYLQKKEKFKKILVRLINDSISINEEINKELDSN